MKDFETYSDVRFMECESLGGGIHYLTTKYKVLFNMNDLFELLDIDDDKALIRRWSRKINSLEIERNIPTTRDFNSCGENYLTIDGVITILNIYGQELIDKINVKNSVDFLICEVLDEVEKDDISKLSEGSLSTQFALEAIKLDSRISKGVNDSLIYILESKKDMFNDYHHQPIFNVYLEELYDYDLHVQEIYNILDNIQQEMPSKGESEFSLLLDDEDDSMFQE